MLKQFSSRFRWWKIKRIKPISPALREKKRYLVYEVVSDKKFMYNEVKKAIDEANLRFLGELGLAKSGVIHIDIFKDNKGILKVSNKFVNELKVSLGLIKNINNQNVIVNTISVSGILNKAEKRLEKGGS